MDLAAYRAEFPVTKDWAYLNHAAVAPLPRRVVETMCAFLHARQMGDLALDDFPPATEETRGLAARLVGAAPEEIDRLLNVLEGSR